MAIFQNGRQNIHALISQFLIALEKRSWCLNIHFRDKDYTRGNYKCANLIFKIFIIVGILCDRDVACSAQTTRDRITNPVSGGPGGWPPLSSLLIEPTSSERPVLAGVPSETPDSKRNDKSDTFYQCWFNVGPTSQTTSFRKFTY